MIDPVPLLAYALAGSVASLSLIFRRSIGPVGGLVLAALLVLVAIAITPAPRATAQDGLAGIPRLELYLAAAVTLVLTGSFRGSLVIPSRVEAEARSPSRDAEADPTVGWRGRDAVLQLSVGMGLAVLVTVWNARRLQLSISDPWGPPLWLLSMLIIAVTVVLPGARQLRWGLRWPEPPSARRELAARWAVYVGWGFLGALLIVGAVMRFAGLGSVPVGINGDEGDRGTTAIDVVRGTAPPSWFDSGWYYISMVYFRLLAASYQVFGTSLAGGRALSAVAGVALLCAIAWIGVRHFGWRVGLMATAFGTTGALTLQHSRFTSEAAIAALLIGLTVAGFLEGARSGRRWAFALAGSAGGLGLYFYPSGRLWLLGAAASLLVIWLHTHPTQRWRLVSGALVAAVAAFVAAAPFLVHVQHHQDELTLRYVQTTVLDPQNQERLSYLRPSVPLPKVLILQLERSLGMFDRYPDGGGFLPMNRSVFPQPLAGLTMLAIPYVLLRALRDVRLALLSIWFWLGLSGVILTVETPNYLRAVGLVPVLPLVLALLLVDTSERLSGVLARALGRVNLFISRMSIPAPVHGGRTVSCVALGLVALVVMSTDTYFYFWDYGKRGEPWAYATNEGLQVAELGKLGPVYALEASSHMVNSGWVRLLAPDAVRGSVTDPGQQLPILASSPASDPTRPAGGEQPLPVPSPGKGMVFLVYPDPNQAPYVSLLRLLYPGGVFLKSIDGRRPYFVSADALDGIKGVTAQMLDRSGPATIVDTFGDLPAGLVLPAKVQWRAGVRFNQSGRYRVRLVTGRPAVLAIDGVQMASVDRAATVVSEIVVARGLHYVQLTTDLASPADHPTLARTSVLAGDGGNIEFRDFEPRGTYALMDAPWGLLAHTLATSGADATVSGQASELALDDTVSAVPLQPYLQIPAAPFAVAWTGWLLAPLTGTYRMAFASDGDVSLDLDGRRVDVQQLQVDQWGSVGQGTPVRLAAGFHQVRVTLTMMHGGRSVVRWNWVPPAANGLVNSSGDWSVVPPTALRPEAPLSLISDSVDEANSTTAGGP